MVPDPHRVVVGAWALPKATLRSVGRLGPAKLHELDGALAIALGLQ